MKNTTKVWLFLIFISFASLILGYKIGDRLGLLIGFLGSLLFLFLVFVSGPNRLMNKFSAQELYGQDPWNLNERAMGWAHRLGLRAPRVFVMEHPTATAFSLRQPWGTSTVCVSTGLLKKLSHDEVEAVLVHQVCHIYRMDNLVFSIASLLADAILTLAEYLDFWWPLKKHKPFRTLLAPVAWLFIRLNVRDRSYFENDDLAVQIMPDRKLLAQVLWKLESLNQARPVRIPDCSSHLFVVNPRGLQEAHWFYTTHPKMDLRLKRLIGSEYF